MIAWLLSAVFAAGVSVSVLRIPVQTTDSLIPLLDAQKLPSVTAAIVTNLGSNAYLRPMRIAQIQLLFELSRGRIYLAFKGFHVGLVVAAFALFACILDPRTPLEAAALAVGLTVLTGLHTFFNTVAEAYPINHFLEIAVCCLAAFAVAQSRGGWWADLAAVLIFALASLTLESGLLVWLVVVTAWLLGMGGISTRGVMLVTMLLGAYLYLRFAYFSTGLPDLMERSSGFGTARLEPEELTRRFGQWPYGFYAYNVVSSIVSVLLSEPRAGVWELVGDLSAGRMVPGSVVNVGSSAITTAAIGWYALRRRHAWIARTFSQGDRIVLTALVLLAGNAALSYAYTKDEIMSPAGVFYALAAAVAIHEALQAFARGAWQRRREYVAAALLVIASSGWAIRSLGLHYRMHEMAYYVRNEWVEVYEWLEEQEETPDSNEARALVDALRNQAIDASVVNPALMSPWGRRLIR
jgi:hypothetical protein